MELDFNTKVLKLNADWFCEQGHSWWAAYIVAHALVAIPVTSAPSGTSIVVLFVSLGLPAAKFFCCL